MFSDSVGQSASQLPKESCTVNDLHPLVRQSICKKLDIKHPAGRDYRALAAHFDMPKDDIIIISQNPDPTDHVLQWVGRNPKNNIPKLLEILQTMGREDCVMIIDESRLLGKCSFMVKLLHKFRNFLSSRRKSGSNHLAACMHLHGKACIILDSPAGTKSFEY